MLTYNFESPIIDGEAFSRLLDLCFRQSEYFSFSDHGILNTDNTLQNRLSGYIYKDISTSHWFNYITLPENPFNIIVYHANSATHAILKEYCHRLLLFDSQCLSSSWNQTFEDLCFFTNDNLILGTVSHEHMCEVFPPDDAFKNELYDIYPHWKEASDSTEQIKLSDYLTEHS